MWREKIDKKIFESSKGKASQKERRKFIVDLKRWPDSNTGVVADNFKNMINDKEKIKNYLEKMKKNRIHLSSLTE